MSGPLDIDQIERLVRGVGAFYVGVDREDVLALVAELRATRKAKAEHDERMDTLRLFASSLKAESEKHETHEVGLFGVCVAEMLEALL